MQKHFAFVLTGKKDSLKYQERIIALPFTIEYTDNLLRNL